MSIRIEYVSRLDDICEPAAAFLASGQDIFECQHIVVPTMGVKAWLTSQLATRLGVSKPGALDGVVAMLGQLLIVAIAVLATAVVIRRQNLNEAKSG